jgi:hypothetical protein
MQALSGANSISTLPEKSRGEIRIFEREVKPSRVGVKVAGAVEYLRVGRRQRRAVEIVVGFGWPAARGNAACLAAPMDSGAPTLPTQSVSGVFRQLAPASRVSIQ